MKITNYTDPFPFITIEQTFDEEEINLMWNEIKFLYYANKFNPPEKTGGAYDTIDGKKVYKKNNSGIWLSEIYKQPEFSNIFSVNRKIIENKEEIFSSHPSWFYKNIYFNEDNTLISYYENGGYYKEHTDNAYITCLTWFHKQPKKFKGGNLVFTDYKIQIEVLNNCTVIFPSCIKHSVTEVEMVEKDCGDLNGRVCMTQFIGVSLR